MIYVFFIFLTFLFNLRTPTAFGGSQARCPIRAVAAGLHHSPRPNLPLRPTPQLMDVQDP